MKKAKKQLKDKKTVVTLKELELKQVKGGSGFCVTPWD